MKRIVSFSVLIITALSLLTVPYASAGPNTQGFELPEVIQLDSGKISGVPEADSSVIAYKGIPYAAPPVGDLRWQPPQPVEAWEDVLVADAFGNSAIQPAQEPFRMWSEEFIISNKNYSEDSLTLNVWTDASSDNATRPVIVYIHGGGLTTGGSSCDVYSGAEIAKKDVVYVSINYRVGIFGFFNHPELSQESPNNVSGNYGVMDAIAALEWVKTNIAAFGGDPGNVTIMGQSAGSRMVHALVISPLANGLFHRAVAESANPIMSGAMGGGNLAAREEVGTAVMEFLGAESLADLRAMSAEELQEQVSAFDSGTGRAGYPTSITIDGYVIPDTDLGVYQQGIQNDVPLMTGSVTGDAGMFGGSATVTVAQYEETAVAQYGDMAEEFLALYPAENDDDATFIANNVIAIHRMNMLIYVLAEARALNGEADTYMYYFTRAMPAADGIEEYGAFHTADVPYFFNYFYQSSTRPWTETDYALGDTMSSYLANFAKTGDPNGEGLPTWPAFSADSVDLIELGDEVQVYSGMTQEQADFWKTYFNSSLGL